MILHSEFLNKQQNLGLNQDPGHKPLSEKDFKEFLNKIGEMTKPRDFRLAVYRGGVEPQMRKVVWKHILGVYPDGLSGRERVEFMKKKILEYEDLKRSWLEVVLGGRLTDDLKYVTNMVKKDVLRTDRHLPFFSGEGNVNVNLLYNILVTYSLNHPSVGYCQVQIPSRIGVLHKLRR